MMTVESFLNFPFLVDDDVAFADDIVELSPAVVVAVAAVIQRYWTVVLRLNNVWDVLFHYYSLHHLMPFDYYYSFDCLNSNLWFCFVDNSSPLWHYYLIFVHHKLPEQNSYLVTCQHCLAFAGYFVIVAVIAADDDFAAVDAVVVAVVVESDY